MSLTFGGLLLETKKHAYRSLVRVFCFLVVWLFGIIFISQILIYLPYAFLHWFFTVVYTLILCHVFCSFFEHKSVWDLGLKVRRDIVLGFVLGVFVGISMITIVFLIEYGLGLVHVKVNSVIEVKFVIYGLLASLSVAFMEELVFRGYFLQSVLPSLGEEPSFLISSIAFGLMHIFNPNVNFLAIVVISVIGVLLAICYLKTRTLYMPMGLHFAWNFFEGYIYGFPISGNKVEGVLVTMVEGATWLTGGEFGPEGSLIGLIISLVVTLIAFILYSSNKRKQ